MGQALSDQPHAQRCDQPRGRLDKERECDQLGAVPRSQTLKHLAPQPAPLDALVAEIRACRVCAGALPHEPAPVIWVHPDARILIAGQAPGRRVHESGIPWNDPSGDRLREWMKLDRDAFYDRRNIAVAAMGFCYPGTVNGADLPPRRECAPLWRPRLLPLMQKVKLTLLVGGYAHKYHLREKAKPTLCETVRAWREYPANVVPLPHPSWRNTGWLNRNPWFEKELLPVLRRRVKAALA